MNRLGLAMACAGALFAATANAETVEDLKREWAAKKAAMAKWEQRLRDLENRPPRGQRCRRPPVQRIVDDDDGGWVPTLVGSVGWTSPTSRGSAFTPIPYVSGFQAGLTASKRFDPM